MENEYEERQYFDPDCGKKGHVNYVDIDPKDGSFAGYEYWSSRYSFKE